MDFLCLAIIVGFFAAIAFLAARAQLGEPSRARHSHVDQDRG